MKLFTHENMISSEGAPSGSITLITPTDACCTVIRFAVAHGWVAPSIQPSFISFTAGTVNIAFSAERGNSDFALFARFVHVTAVGQSEHAPLGRECFETLEVNRLFLATFDREGEQLARESSVRDILFLLRIEKHESVPPASGECLRFTHDQDQPDDVIDSSVTTAA